MKSEDILRSLVGWKCPCCGTIFAPQIASCMHCSPLFRQIATENAIDPRLLHDCPRMEQPPEDEERGKK